MGIFSAYNFSLIGRICALTGASSYTQAWQQTLGTHTAWIPALSCTVKTMFALLAYSIVLAETFVGFVKALGLGFTRSQTLFGLTSIVLLPLCLMKNLSSLAPFSLMGILAMVCFLCCETSCVTDTHCLHRPCVMLISTFTFMKWIFLASTGYRCSQRELWLFDTWMVLMH